MAVGFLPLIAVRPAIVMMEADPLVQLNAALHALMMYYNATWLNGDFPPAMWNVHAATTRTNNVVEGWHSRVNKAIGCCHPNVYKLVTVLKGEQATTELTLRRATTSTTTEIPGPWRTTGPTTGPIQTGTVDDWRLLDSSATRGAPLLNWQLAYFDRQHTDLLSTYMYGGGGGCI